MNIVSFTLGLSLLFAPEPPAHVVVVVGAAGATDYSVPFAQWADRWRQAAERGQAQFTAIGLEGKGEGAADREALRAKLTELAGEGTAPLWLVLIGHGTFDSKTPRFNLRGEDVSANDVANWLRPLDRPVAVVNCASCSGPFVNALSGPNRIVVTATRSGSEHNYARFGDYVSAALLDTQADLDKDEQTSLLEAFLFAAARVREFYEGEGRLTTEHALLDDNGDRLGTPPDWFEGVVAVKTAKNGVTPDGLWANQWHLIRSASEQQLPAERRARRDQLERQLAKLRSRKDKLEESDYLNQIEPLLLELARLYDGESAEGQPAE